MNKRDVMSVAFGFVIASAIVIAPAMLVRTYGQKCSNQYAVNSSAWTTCVMKATFRKEIDIASR
jgi:hypothetical protein